MKKLFIQLLFIISIVLKLNAQANFIWAKQIGGIENDIANSIAVDPNCNVYTTGTFSGTVDFDPGSGIFNLTSLGGSNVFVSKLDAAGSFVWTRQIGNGGSIGANSIIVDLLGNVYTTGVFNGTADFDPGVSIYNLTSTGGNNTYVVKMDASGAFAWAKSFIGSINNGRDISVDPSGNVYISGYFFNTVDFDPSTSVYNLTSLGSEDAFTVKLDNSGGFLWAKCFGASSYEVAWSNVVDVLGNVYITGTFNDATDFDPGSGVYTLTNTAGNADIFISKLDAGGNFVFAKNMGGTSDIFGLSLAIDPSNNIYTTGYFFGTVDFDPGMGIYTLTSNGSTDIFVSKLDATGAFLFAKQIGGASSDEGSSINVDGAGNIYTTGVFNGICDFDPESGVYNLSAAGGRDIFISKLNASGTFVWAKRIGGIANDWGTSVALDAVGNVCATGYFNNVVDFDPGTGIYNLASVGANGNYDAFVLKLDNSVGIEEISSINDYPINVYPNPSTNGVIKLSLSEKGGFPNNISILDLFGRTILTINNINSYHYDLNLADVSDGMLIVKANYTDRIITKRILKN